MIVKEFTFKILKYAGYKIEVDLNRMNQTDFIGLWDKVMDEASLNEGEYYIGYEDYRTITPNHKTMTYYALAPRSSLYKFKDTHAQITLKEGTYLLFENTISNHGTHFFRSVYDYIQVNSIDIDKTFDLEVIPHDFDRNQKGSVIYVGVLRK